MQEQIHMQEQMQEHLQERLQEVFQEQSVETSMDANNEHGHFMSSGCMDGGMSASGNTGRMREGDMSDGGMMSGGVSGGMAGGSRLNGGMDEGIVVDALEDDGGVEQVASGGIQRHVAVDGDDSTDRLEQEGIEHVDADGFYDGVYKYRGLTFSREELLEVLAWEEGIGTDDTGNDAGNNANLSLDELRANLQTPVASGSSFTVFEACISMLSTKGGQSDRMFERHCKVLREQMLPAGNLLPASLYQMERAVGMQHVHEVMLHMCPKCNAAFPYMKKSEWRGHRYACCDKCTEVGVQANECRRFHIRRNVVVPHKWCYYFGVESAVQSLLQDRAFMKARSEFRRGEDPYYTSPEAARLYAAAGLDITRDTHVLGFAVGLDGGGPLKKKDKHSTWVYLLQCMDIGEEYRNLLRFVLPIVITPGPKQPDYFATINQLIAAEFAKGLEEGATVVNADGVEEHVRWVLTHVAGDAPALRHVTMQINHTGIRGCIACKGVSVRGESADGGRGGGQYWPPYLEHGVDMREVGDTLCLVNVRVLSHVISHAVVVRKVYFARLTSCACMITGARIVAWVPKQTLCIHAGAIPTWK